MRYPFLQAALILISGALAGCSNQVRAHGTFDEVWSRTQHAMQTARFETAGSGARHERLERDRASGTLRYVWSDGTFFDARVVTLSITPADGESGAACPAIERTIRIDAWTWGLWGWARFSDAQATQEAFSALTAEFARELSEPSASEASFDGGV